jgi:hypothetical protein
VALVTKVDPLQSLARRALAAMRRHPTFRKVQAEYDDNEFADHQRDADRARDPKIARVEGVTSSGSQAEPRSFTAARRAATGDPAGRSRPSWTATVEASPPRL